MNGSISIGSVDAVNASFYGRFQYPPSPVAFYAPADPYFETLMLNQSIGSWDHSIIPRNLKIWVAGCGTNQAVFAGLRFPESSIVASDISGPTLATSAGIAQRLGVKNIEFRQESINGVDYRDEYDYVICTGVIHHNADPSIALSNLVPALKSTGILELMVYNRYHRIMTTAFQDALRIVVTGRDFDEEMRLARKIIDGIKLRNIMAKFLEAQKEREEAEFADALLQPVEHSFTVESLESLAASCGLEMIAPCITEYDKAQERYLWNMEFDDAEISALYYSQSDIDRWRISNHLMMEKSPMLWFYFQREDCGRKRPTEEELCEQFLERKYARCRTMKWHYLRAEDGCYESSPLLLEHPGSHPDPLCDRIIAAVAAQPEQTMRGITEQLGIKNDFATINTLRLRLTTSAFPYLRSA